MEAQTQSQSYAGNNQTEDRFTKTVEEIHGTIYTVVRLLGNCALAAISASLAFQVAGRGKWGNFIVSGYRPGSLSGFTTRWLSSRAMIVMIAPERLSLERSARSIRTTSMSKPRSRADLHRPVRPAEVNKWKNVKNSSNAASAGKNLTLKKTPKRMKRSALNAGKLKPPSTRFANALIVSAKT